MKILIKSFAITAISLAVGSSAAFAESGSEAPIQRAEIAGSNLIEPTEVGFATVSETKTTQTRPRFSKIVDMAGTLPADGAISSWTDAGGNPISVARFNNDFLVKSENGPTSRITIRPMPETVEPQIAGSAVAVRFRSSVVNVAD